MTGDEKDQTTRNAVCLICTDRRRSLEFYQKAFGAKLLPGDSVMTTPWIQLGELTISLLENTDRVSPVEYSEHAMIVLQLYADDLTASFERTVKHGAKVIEPPDEDLQTFLVADPDGILIEVNHWDD